jgi:hypothetical protein
MAQEFIRANTDDVCEAFAGAAPNIQLRYGPRTYPKKRVRSAVGIVLPASASGRPVCLLFSVRWKLGSIDLIIPCKPHLSFHVRPDTAANC